jgi:hypothetical protein
MLYKFTYEFQSPSASCVNVSQSYDLGEDVVIPFLDELMKSRLIIFGKLGVAYPTDHLRRITWKEER